MTKPAEFECVAPDGTVLRGDAVNLRGQKAILLLHGLTSHRRLVLMGSRKLERLGYPIIRFDARGHGLSEAAQGGGYSYSSLVADAREVLRFHRIESSVVVGVSMGAHTAAALALDRPGLVQGLILVTPAYDPLATPAAGDRWISLAEGLEESGVDGFVGAIDFETIDQRWHDTVKTASRQRMEAHADLAAVAAALREVPASRPFERLGQLGELNVPATVIGSRDGPDPTHPAAVARSWADALPDASFEIESADESPLAWRGAAISEAVESTLRRSGFCSD